MGNKLSKAVCKEIVDVSFDVCKHWLTDRSQCSIAEISSRKFHKVKHVLSCCISFWHPGRHTHTHTHTHTRQKLYIVVLRAVKRDDRDRKREWTLLSPVPLSGICCLTTLEMPAVLKRPSNRCWRQSSWRSTSVFSALEILWRCAI